MSYLTWKFKSFKFLLIGKNRISGRNNTGRIVVYHRGGGVKRKLRIVDYYRFLWNVTGFILRIEYDPNRSALLALVVYSNGIFSYIISPEGLNVGDIITASISPKPLPGNSTYLSEIPIGVKINSVELFPNKGSKFVRSAGSYAVITKKEVASGYVFLKLRSGEVRKFFSDCIAVYGSVSNFEFRYKRFNKAGYYRRKGWRPVVRGVAMNPIDHPHGGGQGKTSGGRPSVSPSGVITKGIPTVKRSNPYIIISRKRQKKKKSK